MTNSDSAQHAGGPGPGERRRGGVRERILDAAMLILRESGLKRLTQVAVAERAGVRQSHLTYYFPTRDDLLEAVVGSAVGAMACAIGAAVESGGAESGTWLERLVDSVAELEHMRMFVGMIVEADVDVSIRALMVEATVRMEAVVAKGLGGAGAEERARRVLAAAWGIGLYRFVMRADATSPDSGWLIEAFAPARGSRRASRTRRSS
jgi:AcrR family transcriptional regulator